MPIFAAAQESSPTIDSLTTVEDKTPMLQRIDKFMAASSLMGEGRLRLPKSL